MMCPIARGRRAKERDSMTDSKILNYELFDCDSTILVVWKRGNEPILRYRLTPDGMEAAIKRLYTLCQANPKFSSAFASPQLHQH